MFPVAYAADHFGRRRRMTIQFTCLVYMFGGAMQSGAPTCMDMTLMGVFFLLVMAEIAHPSTRGRLTTLQQFMLGIGAFCASWIVFRVHKPSGEFLWVSRCEDAAAALARLHAHGNKSDVFVQAQAEDIQAEIQKSKEIGSASWGELFRVPSNFRRLSLGFTLQFSVQMTGVSAIQYYSTDIFTTMGFTSTRILLFQSINSIIALIGEACCVIWVDHTGRRRPLVVGNIAPGLLFVVRSVLMARWPGTVDNDAAHYNMGAQLLQCFYRPTLVGVSC
ncbi:MFS general substrate transporter [Marasmius fiardii PR-910]|nr:MFS general substrate transporter [Marasmius fiardii PR-910]